MSEQPKVRTTLPRLTMVLALTCLCGCASKDLIVDFGQGDSIRLVGAADSFDCDDPAYKHVTKVQTWTMHFADGTAKSLCARKESIPIKTPANNPSVRQDARRSSQPGETAAPMMSFSMSSGQIESARRTVPDEARESTAKGQTLPVESQQRISMWFKEAALHSDRGDLVAARDAFGKVLAILPEHGPAQHNHAQLDQRIQKIDADTAALSALISDGSATARIHADRGIKYVRAGDFGRGFTDLDRAVKQAPTDAQIAVDRAVMYLAANRLEDAQELCTRLVEIFPDLAKAYEVRAWAGLLLGRGEMAHADAVASLMVSSPWTATRFAQERAAYRVLAGYFTLLQIASPAKAREWVQQWAGLLRKDAWPDVVALSFAAEVDERKALAVAEKLHPEDRGNALGEATVFLALDRYLAENSEGGMRRMQDFFSTRYSAGHTLALVIRERLANKKRRAVLAKFPEKTP